MKAKASVSVLVAPVNAESEVVIVVSAVLVATVNAPSVMKLTFDEVIARQTLTGWVDDHSSRSLLHVEVV